MNSAGVTGFQFVTDWMRWRDSWLRPRKGTAPRNDGTNTEETTETVAECCGQPVYDDYGEQCCGCPIPVPVPGPTIPIVRANSTWRAEDMKR